jgi:uncharacterized OsmC-like protein
MHPIRRGLVTGRDVGGQRIIGGRIAVGRRHSGEAQPVSRHPSGGFRRAAVFHVSSLWHGGADGNVADMQTDPSAHRSVRLERIENSSYLVTNDRGGQIRIGRGEGTDFTPVDLLLAGIGGCTAVDVDLVTSRRAEPESFEVVVDAEKVRDEAGNHLSDILVTFRIRFPEGEEGDKARALLPDIIEMSHDRLCTVSRTVELATPVATRIE